MVRAIASVLLLFLHLAARGDGMIVPTQLYPAEVKIPDQQALICFSNGIERLVIETRFSSAGSNFAWVVPFPAKPKIEPATTGLFPTLQYLFRPKIIHDEPRAYVWILFFIWIGHVAFNVRRTLQITAGDMLSSVAVAAAIATIGIEYIIAGVFAAIVLLLFIAIIRYAEGSVTVALYIALLILGAFFVVAPIALPSMAKARTATISDEGSNQSTLILDRQLIGDYETTLIQARDANDLQRWLRVNGFNVPARSDAAIRDYIQEGWVFVATKLRRPQTNFVTSTPHPLSFTFKTDKPVYPMRLTAAAGSAVALDLYVFGPARAHARGFKAERCARPINYTNHVAEDFFSYQLRYKSDQDSIHILHPLLRHWAPNYAVATKLSATLTPSDMQEDIWLDWESYTETQNHVFTASGAAILSANWTSGFLGAGLLVLGVMATQNPERRSKLERLAFGSIPFALLLSIGIFACLPRMKVHTVRASSMDAHYALEDVYYWIEGATNRAEARAAADDYFAKYSSRWHYRAPAGANLFAGGTIHEEDSPGNYVLRGNDTNFEFVAFDAAGEDHVLGKIPRQ